LVIPLARRSRRVTGVDISQTMLDEARRNCEALDLANVDFALSDAFLASRPAGGPGSGIDFAHSFIVLQHISPRDGERILDHFLTVLRPGGVGALHFTYERRASLLRKAVHRLRRWVPGVNAAVNLVQRRPVFEPQIPMYEYDVGRLLTRLTQRGCSAAHLLLTDHGGHLGAVILFRVP
jgi:SAM-dependent methyltransferase